MKKNFKWNEKKANIIVSRTTLCTQKNYILHEKKISENVRLRTKFDLGLKKKTKKNNFGANFHLKKLLCRHKKMPIVEIP